MPNIYVTPYQFKIYRKHHPDEPEEFDQINADNGSVDLLPIVENYVESMLSEQLVAEDDRIFKVERYSTTNRVVHGSNIGGEYGYEADRINVQTKRKLGRKSKYEADMIPLYYHVYIPKGRTIGVVFFQSLGHFSASSRFLKGLKQHAQKELHGFTFAFERAIDGEMLNRYLEKVREVVLTRNTLPKEMDVNFVTGGYSLDSYHVDYRVRPRTRNRLTAYFPRFIADRVHKYLQGEISKSDILTIPGFEADDIKFVTEYEGHVSTISINDPHNINVRIDLTEKVRSLNGHADYSMIHEEVLKLQDKYIK